MMPNRTDDPLRPRFFKSLKNSLQEDADSLSPLWRERTSFVPSSLTPMTTRTGTRSILSSILIRKLTPSIKRYLIFSRERSRLRHFSTAAFSSVDALLTSVGERDRPMSRLLRRERLHDSALSCPEFFAHYTFLPRYIDKPFTARRYPDWAIIAEQP